MGLFGRKSKQDQDDSGLPGSGEPNELSKLEEFATSMSSGPPSIGQILTGRGPGHDLLKEIRSDPQGFRDRLLAETGASGGTAFVVTPQGMTPIGHPPDQPVPTHVDAIDQLTKAAELHDKGELTDAEFEQLKHKLLGE
jgi:hypothetical protein